MPSMRCAVMPRGTEGTEVTGAPDGRAGEGAVFKATLEPDCPAVRAFSRSPRSSPGMGGKGEFDVVRP